MPIDQSLTVNVCGNDLCVINYKGGRAPLGLTSYTGFRGASFSPDGTHIVFSACLIAELTNPACWDLFIIDRISKSVTPLIRDPNTITVTPAWSPDGEWIAYNSGCNLALIRVDGSDEQTLMVAPGGPDSLCLYPFQAWTVAWSPDSKQIATVLGINHTTSFDSPTDVWVVNADGSGDVRPILHSDRHIIAMAWSPDNQSVEVDLDNAKSYQLDPYCNSKPNGCDATSRTLTKTIPKTWFANYYPQWAGAAATVTPATSASTNATLTATNSLAASQGSIVSICNGDLCILPPTGASIYLGLNASYTNFYGESWSPDGTRIVFSACRIVDFRNQKCMELFITSADGKTVTPLGQGANFMPAWSPDGKQIAYNFCGVSIIRPDGYGKTEVLPCLTTYHVSVDTSFLHPIAWSPNSRQLAVLMGVAHNENPAAPYVDPPTRVWIIDSYRSGTIRTIFKASQSITALAWSPDGRSVVVALQDGTAYKIDASCKPQGDACDASSQTKIDSVPVSWIANFYPQWAGETVSR